MSQQQRSADPRPVSFLLMGQRFAIDSYITGSIVYDRVLKDGQPVLRALPSLDVMYALGNERCPSPARSGCLSIWRKSERCANRWMGLHRVLAIFHHQPLAGDDRTLNGEARLQTSAMRTAAWADRCCRANLPRGHNCATTIFSMSNSRFKCDDRVYPAGYVEPYLTFAAMYDYAHAGQALASLPQTVLSQDLKIGCSAIFNG